MHYFDKPASRMSVNIDNIHESYVTNARQMFDEHSNQNPSNSFGLYWLILRRETYRQASKVHPHSLMKRAAYLRAMFPHGLSIYRNPSRFLRWYLSRNNNCLMGDPTGQYLRPINTHELNADSDRKSIGEYSPMPNALADNFTLTVFKYLKNLPKVRYTRKAIGYGYVEFTLPIYCYIDPVTNKVCYSGVPDRKTGNAKIRLTGYLTEWELEQYFKAELRKYLQLYIDTVDPRYLQLLKNQIGEVNF